MWQPKSDQPSWDACRPWLDLRLLSARCSQTSQPSSPLVEWELEIHSTGLALACCMGDLTLCGLRGTCGVRWLLLSRGFGGGGVRGKGLSSWYCRAKSNSGLGRGSEFENVMRSWTTGGSGMSGLGEEISSSKGVQSSREGRLVRGGTFGAISRQRPSPTEARREPPPSRARWVLLTRPPRDPLSGLGEPAGEEPPSSLPESPWGRGSRRLSFTDEPAKREKCLGYFSGGFYKDKEEERAMNVMLNTFIIHFASIYNSQSCRCKIIMLENERRHGRLDFYGYHSE